MDLGLVLASKSESKVFAPNYVYDSKSKEMSKIFIVILIAFVLWYSSQHHLARWQLAGINDIISLLEAVVVPGPVER